MDEIYTNVLLSRNDGFLTALLALSDDTFELWRIMNATGFTTTVPTSSSSTTSGEDDPPLSNPRAKHSEVERFHARYKISLTDYPDLKDDSYFLKWEREFSATLNVHGLTDVIDESIDVSSLVDEQLETYKAHQNFVYKAFMKTLKTGRTRVIIKENEKKIVKTHSIYQNLVDTFRHGPSGYFHRSSP